MKYRVWKQADLTSSVSPFQKSPTWGWEVVNISNKYVDSGYITADTDTQAQHKAVLQATEVCAQAHNRATAEWVAHP